MKVKVCYFSWVQDAKLLELSLRSVHRLQSIYPEHDIDVVVFDDEHAPLEMPPDGIRCITTAWDRKGNLNGLENLVGMLGVFRQHIDDGADVVIKLDCDTYVNNLDFLDGVDLEKTANIGTYNRAHNFAHGCFYCMTPSGIAAISELLKRADIVARINKGPGLEDLCFGTLAQMSGLHCERLDNTDNAAGAGRGCYCDFDWGHGIPFVPDEPYEKLIKHCGVAFKTNSWNRNAEQRIADRLDAEVRMERYADWADSQPRKQESRELTDEEPDMATE